MGNESRSIKSEVRASWVNTRGGGRYDLKVVSWYLYLFIFKVTVLYHGNIKN